MAEQDIAERLLSTRVADLPKALAEELEHRGRRRTLRKGAVLHRKGDSADGLYQVISGRVRISTLAADGREAVLTDLEPGAFFGEISLFDGLPRTHDAVALERSELLFVTSADFHALLGARPELLQHYARALAFKLRLCMAALDGVTLQSVSTRLAQRLLWLAHGSSATQAQPLTKGPRTLAISQSDLASMVGATRQTINKELKAWERDGVVRVRGRMLELLNEVALREAALR